MQYKKIEWALLCSREIFITWYERGILLEKCFMVADSEERVVAAADK